MLASDAGRGCADAALRLHRFEPGLGMFGLVQARPNMLQVPGRFIWQELGCAAT
jgi:hypothetical protein